MIPITRPFLPPIEEYKSLLEGIWERQYLTNNGPILKQLEQNLNEYLGTKYINFLGNGTIALQIAIKALDLKGEIITTPFSYVATTSSIVWEGCKPVFADIDPKTLNIDPSGIEKCIGTETTGILATHVYGNICDVDAIDSIAQKHGLKVIYDAAHAFGVSYKGKSIFEYGDISTTSFHATKLFHTVEGGAVFTKSKELHDIMGRLRNFGHHGEFVFKGVGINGKNSEFHAAMGLVNLRYIDEILEKRKKLSLAYDEAFEGCRIGRPGNHVDFTPNHSYYPILFQTHEDLISVVDFLKENDVFPRRYFYPSLSSLEYVEPSVTPVSDQIADRVLCLPMYHDLSIENVNFVAKLIKSKIK